jgi:ParB/RepB/Spo0J family partition protein
MSRTDHDTTGHAKSVPFNKIFIDPKINSRKKLRDIPELAKNIDENGLQSALLVTNGGDAEHPYTLVAGFRRGAALNTLKWGSKLVNVIVVDDAQGSNLIENILREPLPALDLAKRLAEMKEGTYYVPNDGETRKWTNAELSKLLSRSQSHITNFVRVHESLTDEVKNLIGPFDPPGRLLFVWAGKTPAKQLEAAQEWVKYQKNLEKAGKTRKAHGEGDPATSNSSKPGKKVLTEKFEQLTWKSETARAGSKEAEIAAAVAESLRFVLGDVKRFPIDVWTGEDAKAYKAARKEEAAEESEEEVEEYRSIRATPIANDNAIEVSVRKAA